MISNIFYVAAAYKNFISADAAIVEYLIKTMGKYCCMNN